VYCKGVCVCLDHMDIFVAMVCTHECMCIAHVYVCGWDM